MEFTMIRLEKVESVATITLNRPEKMNTYTAAMLSELATVLEDVALDDSIRAVILTGEGRAFCAGADLKEAQDIQKELPENQDILKLLNRVVLAIRQAPKPFVASVAENFINVGLVPDGGGTYFLTERIGYHRAAEIFFTGKILDAQEALNLGLYNRVVQPEEVVNAARELAEELAAQAPLALAADKALLNREVIPRLRSCLEDEARNQRAMMGTKDVIEGVTAFIEKRKPKFTGK
jgi:2-(1,2-epoxy-1,2-dihydrophenyl)acetyl-CoA isomerase